MSKDKPIFAFIRRGEGLVPETGYDMAALDGIAHGQRVKVEIKQWRNNDRLRSYWMMLHDCVEATGCAPTKEALHEYVKMMAGLVAFITRSNGMPAAVPASVSFEAMGEAEFIRYYETAQAVLAREFGYVRERAV